MTISSKNQLSTFPNPYRNKTYVISIIQEITLNRQAFLLGLRFVPDKLLLDHESLAGYLEKILASGHKKAEILAHEILEDIMDQVIPKWIEVNLRHEENKFGQKVMIIMEDNQPGWKNEALLKRLPAIF